MNTIITQAVNRFAIVISAVAAFGCAISGCKSAATEQKDSVADVAEVRLQSRVHFDSDSAYSYVNKQVAIGPRVAGSEKGRLCCEYIESELKRHGADEVNTQDGKVEAWNGDNLSIRNVMARFNPENDERILLVTHYDTRPWADCDDTEENRSLPIPGANNGASGVGVLLEVARQLGMETAPVGVDILFVDAEDYGRASGFSLHEKTWALGTQHWLKTMPYNNGNKPKFAVMLDMVGGIDAKFHREYHSDRFAKEFVDQVWDIADRSGFGDRFINKPGGAVIDDHVFLSKAGIPTVEIIETKNDETKTFPRTWHTMSDDMRNIERGSLKAAGQTVVNLIYED